MNIFDELKRRNVFRVAVAYVMVSWLLIQVIGLAAESFEAPLWVMKMIIAIALIGFIPALLFSWAFELTPNGIKKDAEVTRADSITNETANKLNVITIIAAVAVVGLVFWQQMSGTDSQRITEEEQIPTTATETTQSQSEISDKSIAVLPFVNMSSDKEQEYFADGISEEILNVLVRIPKLKVAGRTSSFSFKGKNEDLRLIGKALNVNHILEGSVRRSGTKMRITAQLIRSNDGYHLWSDTYDREIADIFDIQDEIAKKVAEQLAISLGLNSETKVHERTKDLVAYENYLKAKQLFLLRGRENLDEALKLLNEATSRDPNFAPAWTSISLVYNVYDAYETTKEREASLEERAANINRWIKLGKSAAQQALLLDPDSAEAHVAMGSYFLDNLELIKAFKQFDLALSLSPNNPIILDIISQNSLELGYFQQVLQLSKKAIAIDPLVAMYRNTEGSAYKGLGKTEKAIASYEKAIELDPSLVFPYRNLWVMYYNPDDFDKLIPLVARGIKNKAISMDGFFTKNILFRDYPANKALLNDKKTLRQTLLNTEDRAIQWAHMFFLKDVDFLIKRTEKDSWNNPNRRGLNSLFWTLFPGLYEDKRWKEQMRKDGVLALWQSRGFPANCKPIGEDDFECVLYEQEK